MHTSITDYCWTRDMLSLAHEASLCGMRLASLSDLVDRADAYDEMSDCEEVPRAQGLLQEAAEILWISASAALQKHWPACILGLPDGGGEEARLVAKQEIRLSLVNALDLLARTNGSRVALEETSATYRSIQEVRLAILEISRMLGIEKCTS